MVAPGAPFAWSRNSRRWCATRAARRVPFLLIASVASLTARGPPWTSGSRRRCSCRDFCFAPDEAGDSAAAARTSGGRPRRLRRACHGRVRSRLDAGARGCPVDARHSASPRDASNGLGRDWSAACRLRAMPSGPKRCRPVLPPESVSKTSARRGVTSNKGPARRQPFDRMGGGFLAAACSLSHAADTGRKTTNGQAAPTFHCP